MDIRNLTEDYAVSPQITPDDIAAIRTAGYSMVIDNRPDAEILSNLHAVALRAVIEAVGLTFIENPVIGGALTKANVDAQRSAIDAATGPVLAYCASGNRSSVVWALAMAGRLPTDELIARPARFGYQLESMRAQIDSIIARS